MTIWTPFTLAVVTNALPTDLGQLYTNWITAHPEKGRPLGTEDCGPQTLWVFEAQSL